MKKLISVLLVLVVAGQRHPGGKELPADAVAL